MGDGLGTASTKVFEGATVVETVLEEVDDLLVGDVNYLRTMCGSRTGGWSLPCVMSD
jgi:hypothetical protein